VQCALADAVGPVPLRAMARLPGTAPSYGFGALVAVLMLDPWASLAPGFWLSFGAGWSIAIRRLRGCRPAGRCHGGRESYELTEAHARKG